MGNSSYVSLSLATALERSLSLSAHNLANSSTAGYKAVQPLFAASPSDTAGGGEAISFVKDNGTYLDHSQGSLYRTNNPLDIAVSGSGWLGFETAGGGQAFGRFGQLVVDTEGQIATAAGRRILSADGAPIVIPVEAGQRISIARDGTITDANGDLLGQIGIFKVNDAASLAPIGRGLYAASDGGNNLEVDENAEVVQGYLESSNVEPVLEMTRMIAIQRAYESSIKLMEEEHSLTKQVIQRLGQRV